MYRKGAEAKKKVASSSTLRLPKISEREAAGRLMRMPGMVDAAATMPSKSSGVPRLVAKGLSTGFLDMVLLRIAKKPIAQIMMKKAFWVLVVLSIRCP
jgi:hypothetical protein